MHKWILFETSTICYNLQACCAFFNTFIQVCWCVLVMHELASQLHSNVNAIYDARFHIEQQVYVKLCSSESYISGMSLFRSCSLASLKTFRAYRKIMWTVISFLSGHNVYKYKKKEEERKLYSQPGLVFCLTAWQYGNHLSNHALNNECESCRVV